MLLYLTAIALFEVGGDLFQSLAGLPIPGPVIGMALLLAALMAKGHLPDGLDRAASGILSYLPMLFVPAGVGVMAHFGLLRSEWPAIVAALVISSLLAVVVTAMTMRGMEQLQQTIRNTSHSAKAGVGEDD